MIYLLIEHGDGTAPKKITFCDTFRERELLTLRAIYSDPEALDPEKVAIPELRDLRDKGICHFEGDPSIEWMDASHSVSRLLMEIGEVAEIAEKCAHEARLPIPPHVHIQGLLESMATIAQRLKTLYANTKREDPWSKR